MFTFRIRWIVVLLLVFLLAGAGTLAKAQDFEKAQIGTLKVEGNIYMLTGPGGNIGIYAGKDAVLLVDSQYAPVTDKIRAAVAAITDKPIQFVVNTQWHLDHTGGNENLARGGAVIVAHENVRKRLSTEQFMEFFKASIPPMPVRALPVITFERDMAFHLDGEEIRIFNVPTAHTDGDAIIHFRKSNVLHMGDILFNGLYPYIDLSAGGSINGMIAAVDRVLPLCDGNTKVIPGHGPLTDKAGLGAYRKMLAAVRDRIASEIQSGKTLPEVVAAQPTREFDDAWGKGFLKPEQFTTLVYSSLTGKK
jgi:glyoxylase-like metal-dependent hydrolase (beta-lactamase superfamily II)